MKRQLWRFAISIVLTAIFSGLTWLLSLLMPMDAAFTSIAALFIGMGLWLKWSWSITAPVIASIIVLGLALCSLRPLHACVAAGCVMLGYAIVIAIFGGGALALGALDVGPRSKPTD